MQVMDAMSAPYGSAGDAPWDPRLQPTPYTGTPYSIQPPYATSAAPPSEGMPPPPALPIASAGMTADAPVGDDMTRLPYETARPWGPAATAAPPAADAEPPARPRLPRPQRVFLGRLRRVMSEAVQIIGKG